MIVNESIPSTTSTLSNAFNNSGMISGIDYGSYSGEARLNLACSYNNGNLVDCLLYTSRCV